jgi:unsaturated rhamnogalacturonyl hydrolase
MRMTRPGRRRGPIPSPITRPFWARSIGWYGMALVDILDTLPKNHPDRAKRIALVQQLAQAYTRYQDPATGLWFNVVDQPKLAGNWLETSASSMS